MPDRTTVHVDDTILVADGTWSFAGDVADSFDDHVRCSVPFYDGGHDLVCDIANLFITSGGTGLELGSSTGTLTRRLATHSPRTRSAQWTGIDCVPEMTETARRRHADVPNISFICTDLRDMEFPECQFVVDYLTTHFLRLGDRSDLFSRIREVMPDGGAVFMATKCLESTPRHQALSTALYDGFKAGRGLTADQIASKTASIAGILHQESRNDIQKMLQSAGFREVHLLYKTLFFEGHLAIA